jgi:hypothetical protein
MIKNYDSRNKTSPETYHRAKEKSCGMSEAIVMQNPKQSD